jgi:hypothetical protein
MKTIRKLERLVGYYQDAEKIIKDKDVSRGKTVLSLLFITIAFIFMGAIAYSGEAISHTIAFAPAVLILFAMYVNTWTAESVPGSWLQEPMFFLDDEIAAFKKNMKKAIFHLHPFPETRNEDDKETVKIAQDIIEGK